MALVLRGIACSTSFRATGGWLIPQKTTRPGPPSERKLAAASWTQKPVSTEPPTVNELKQQQNARFLQNLAKLPTKELNWVGVVYCPLACLE